MDKAKTNVKVNELGQKMKEGDPLYWVRKIDSQVNKYNNKSPIVIDDCRFIQEAGWGMGYGFYIINIITTDDTRHNRLLTKYPNMKLQDILDTSSEISETELETIISDYSIIGEGTKENVEREVHLLMNKLRKE